MATLAQKKRSGKSGGHDNKTANRQAEEKKESPAQRKVMRSAYLQTKMAVSTPGDTQEQEADRVADEVSRMPKGVARAVDETAPPGSSQPENNAEQPQSLQTKISRMQEEPEAAHTKLCRAEAENLDTKAARTEEEDLTAQTKLYRQEEEPATTETDTEAASPETPVVADETEQKIESLRGQGNPMADDIRQEMEGKLHADFSRVSIHTSGDADALCKQLSARAFTVGNDIFFAAGEYAPTTEAGRKLLVHELTHVVQQGGDVARKVFREVNPRPAVTPGSEAETKLNELSRLELPPIKHRHAALYTGHGARRAAGYRRNTSEEQVNVWKRDVQLTEDTIAQKIRAEMQRADPQSDFTIPTSSHAHVSFSLPGGQVISGQWRGIRNQLIIPDWDRRGNYLTARDQKFQVDHMIELQVYGDTTGNAGNVAGNLELLKGAPNASSGATIKTKIYEKVYGFLQAQDPAFSTLSSETKANRRRAFLQNHTITFTEMVRGEGRDGNDNDWWTRAEIEEGAHLDVIEPAPATRLEGSSGNFVLASGPGGIEIARYRYPNLNFEPANRRLREAMAGLNINRFELNSNVEQGVEGNDVGSIQATWNLPNNFRTDEPVTIPLKAVGPYCASPGEIPGLNTSFTHLSPVSFPSIELRNGGLYAEGQISPTIPLLANIPISIILEGDDLRFQVEYSTGALNIPIPGLTIDDSTLALFYSTRDGFGGSGRIDFGVNQLGSGNLEVSVSERTGFSAAGQFDFDSELFDRARINIWYREGAFGGSGEIGIDQPDKIRGIRSANLTVTFGHNEFSAEGDIQPDIPGVQQAGLDISYSEEEGLTIGGELQLNADTPGIESGNIEVTLNKQEDTWKVAASGTAVPSIPGINSELTVSYNDGAFTAEIEADYSRGMLSGRVNAGVTNRSVGEDGQTLSETAEPDNPLIVYGGGSLSLQLAPWLQATAGVQFSPNGEITVTGEIGLPDELEIFARREINKSIFNIAVQAPIFPGIVAEIGGGLSATAGIGPGVIDQLRLGVTYNPDHEEDTHITGDAHLNIPANAGLRLSVRAGIGLGITGASATGGLDIGGTLGIEGAAEAGVHVDWTPATGLDIEAEVAVHAQPSFTFDIGGYVSVRALGFSVYDERWEFASYTFGSDYRFGIRLPIHYKEGEPFDISLDDVEFEVPDIDTNQLLRGLIARIA
ncbi:eCIS core domain-containing protein [Cellvibrio sp. ARAG 10.3]|uniref:eCIS core domain-containing protein n=1 Tax=Cellvibrio sp. ARAG 10.3 TaxID=3451358 RepID=UPI003F466F82